MAHSIGVTDFVDCCLMTALRLQPIAEALQMSNCNCNSDFNL